MHVLTITGLLGSGKTTFINQYARHFTRTGLKTAILVNEIGDIGIDDQFMRRLGLDVYEILGGCICCTLTVDLVTTLEKLEREYAPDLVLIEPSGAAEPKSVIQALEKYKGRQPFTRKTLALIDPLRLEAFMEVITPLATALIQRADVIVINKVDAASDRQMAFARACVAEHNNQVPVFGLCANDSPDPGLLKALMSCKA